MSQYIVLSPHFDDAVASCWHTIANKRPIVLTIFGGVPNTSTRTLWDILCQGKSSNFIMRRRIQENEVALKTTGNQIINLGFLDNQYRRDKLTAEMIKEAVIRVIPKESIILAPLAYSKLWRHPDHVLARQVGLLLIKDGYKVKFYPDMPYMMPSQNIKHAADKILARIKLLLNKDFTFDILSLSQKDKLNKSLALKQYRSQYLMTNIVSFAGFSRALKRDYELLFEIKADA